MHIFFPLFFPTFYSVFIKTCIPCSGSTYNTNCCCRIVVAELPLFSPRLAPLLQFSLSPHHGGLEQWTCHEILQKLSPCSCRGDSVVQTLLWSDLWSVRAWWWMSWTRRYLLLQEGRACSPPSWIPSVPFSRLQSALPTPHLPDSPCTSSGTCLIVRKANLDQ